MNNKPGDRYASVAVLLDDMHRFLADQAISVYRDPLSARLARWVRKNPTSSAMAAMGLVFAFLALVATIVTNNAWNARELKRIANLQIAAERAEAEAVSHIKSGDFRAAANILAQSQSLVAGEKNLSQYTQRIRDRQKKNRPNRQLLPLQRPGTGRSVQR